MISASASYLLWSAYELLVPWVTKIDHKSELLQHKLAKVSIVDILVVN